MKQLIERNLKHVWHPCSQMKDFETCPPLVVNQAKGSYLYTDRGPIIDAISSWWCKSLGHAHPRVIAAIEKQLKQFEHVIGANTTFEVKVLLAEQLSEITQKQHVFFASDGATAVEIAMKLALHAALIKGQPHKRQFIALKNSYHGESFATMSVSDLGLYKTAYTDTLGCHFIEPPYVFDEQDPLWQDCTPYWDTILPQLDAVSENACALLLEPIIQGAGGMLCYSADFLKKIAAYAKSKDLYLIADESMTGIGRTGKWLASQHAGIHPDLICLSKGLTSGTLPLSCVLIDSAIYELFYSDYQEGKSFLHSNTYSGHPLALAAALATILTIKEENILERTKTLEKRLRAHFNAIAKQSGYLHNIRGIGAMVAGTLSSAGDFRIGQAVYQEALKKGALLRPIGNTLYWLPPLNIDEETIGKLAQITLNSMYAAYLSSPKECIV